MTVNDLIDDMRRRINPAYAATLGTESYERRICAETLEALLLVQEKLGDEVARLRTQRDYLMSAARRTLDENGHLADGDVCTLIVLKRAVETLAEVTTHNDQNQGDSGSFIAGCSAGLPGSAAGNHGER